jgi:UDP-2,3-diacylglucosamine pyrophosphatase LpxH
MRVLILSDLHLGSNASRSQWMLDGIRRVAREYDRVILNGDTLDRYEQPKCEPESEEWLRDAVDACRSGGGPAEILTGNHDPAISSTHWLYLQHSQTLVFHGDCIADLMHPTRELDQYIALHLRERWSQLGGRPQSIEVLAPEHRAIQGKVMRERPLLREPRTILQYLSSVVYPPQKPYHILQYWMRAPKLAAALALNMKQPVRHVVIGHTHLAGKWDIKGVTVMNTGSYMPISIPHAVCIDGADVKMVRMSRLLSSNRTVVLPLTQPE